MSHPFSLPSHGGRRRAAGPGAQRLAVRARQARPARRAARAATERAIVSGTVGGKVCQTEDREKSCLTARLPLNWAQEWFNEKSDAYKNRAEFRKNKQNGKKRKGKEKVKKTCADT